MILTHNYLILKDKIVMLSGHKKFFFISKMKIRLVWIFAFGFSAILFTSAYPANGAYVNVSETFFESSFIITPFFFVSTFSDFIFVCVFFHDNLLFVILNEYQWKSRQNPLNGGSRFCIVFIPLLFFVPESQDPAGKEQVPWIFFHQTVYEVHILNQDVTMT